MAPQATTVGPRPSRALSTAVGWIAALLALWLIAGAVMSDHSSYFRMVEKDKSWLGYLPPDGPVDINLGGLTTESSSHGQVRRIDLHLVKNRDAVSLCFAASRAALDAGCPGFEFLGTTDRVVEGRYVGLLGDDAVDWLEVLGSQTPQLEDLDYLDE